MGRPSLADTKDTKADLMAAARELIQTRGYNAFSYQDLADKLGIRKASIHYHFPTKEDLGVGILQTVSQRFQTWKEQLEGKNLDPESKMNAYFDYFAAIFHKGSQVCLCGALAVEWDSLPQKIQDATNAHMNNHRAWLKSTLEAGRKAGVFADRGPVEEQAQFIYSTLQGSLQTLRTQGKGNQFGIIGKQILGMLKG